MMDRKTQWASLVAGAALLVAGGIRLYGQGDWTLVIISALIIGFTVSSMLRGRGR